MIFALKIWINGMHVLLLLVGWLVGWLDFMAFQPLLVI